MKKNKIKISARKRKALYKRLESNRILIDTLEATEATGVFGFEITHDNGDLIDAHWGFKSFKDAEIAGEIAAMSFLNELGAKNEKK